MYGRNVYGSTKWATKRSYNYLYISNLNDVISNIEIVGKKIIKIFLSESISNIDSITRKTGKMISDAVSNIEIVGKKIGKKFVYDTITNTENISKKISKLSQLETVTNSDSLTRKVGKMAVETVTNIDSIITTFKSTFRKTKAYVSQLRYSTGIRILRNVSKSSIFGKSNVRLRK